jgi:uncharacterized protein YdcH (DUF465 family)
MSHAQLPADDAKTELLQTDEAFQKLVLEHHELDKRVRQLGTLSFLTLEQEYEEHALKKQKLALKDRIEAMMRGYGMATRSPDRVD